MSINDEDLFSLFLFDKGITPHKRENGDISYWRTWPPSIYDEKRIQILFKFWKRKYLKS